MADVVLRVASTRPVLRVTNPAVSLTTSGQGVPGTPGENTSDVDHILTNRSTGLVVVERSTGNVMRK